MLASQARGHKVMSSASATTVGKVSRFVVDARAGRVVAVKVGKSKMGEYLHWEDIRGFGPDAVVIDGEAALSDLRGRAAELVEAHGKHADLLGKRILDDRGDGLGDVVDVDFDPATGQVLALRTTGADIDGSRLVDCGSYAVVVRAAGPQAGAAPVASAG